MVYGGKKAMSDVDFKIIEWVSIFENCKCLWRYDWGDMFIWPEPQ